MVQIISCNIVQAQHNTACDIMQERQNSVLYQVKKKIACCTMRCNAVQHRINSWGTRQRGYYSERTTAAGVLTVFEPSCPFNKKDKRKLNVAVSTG
jgi:hypothetical protein